VPGILVGILHGAIHGSQMSLRTPGDWQVQAIRKVTAYKMVRCNFSEHRAVCATDINGKAAPGMKIAARRRIRRIGDITL
jgi:hypothetical protein